MKKEKKTIIEQVNNFDDVLRLSGRYAKEYELRPDETPDELAYRKIKLVAEVYNEGTVLDLGNDDQSKYYPMHRVVENEFKPSGFGLSYDGYDGWYAFSFSRVGVRHCFKDAASAIDAGQKFIAMYEDMKIR